MQESVKNIPEEVLHWLAQKALGKSSQSELEQLQRWLDTHPEARTDCQLFMKHIQRQYWLYLANEAKDTQQQLQALQLHRGKKRKLRTRLLTYAATLLILAGFGWYLHQIATETPTETHAETSMPARHNKAMLVLSDGNSLLLDDPASTSMQDESGVKITNRPGELLKYEQEANVQGMQQTNRLIVPAGARYQLELADGTRVWINASSELEYPVQFSGDKRELKLKGEAYFEVNTDANKPFIVETNGYQVKVLGTALNISAYHEDAYLQTTLVSGSASVNEPSGRQHKLVPGEMAQVDYKSKKVQIAQVDIRLYTSWREGILYFNKITLRELAVKLERWYDVDIQFENPQTARLLFSGAMENSREIGFLLDLIGEAAQVDFEIAENSIIVK